MLDDNVSYGLIAVARSFIIVGIIALIIVPLIRAHNVATNPRDLSTYTAYYNGTEVDLDKVDLSLYNVSFDDDSHKVFLTNK